ncbi:hypothetical protein H5410_056736 [Solanum commersonii]|uniref:Uncharacterized protein n=1 Tax=Solanum commersonii TaxID=4109 RepID=A0A9J5WM62_SOLCO|nr:hypothetical protein H5410_056736 [Solanum commersonii]
MAAGQQPIAGQALFDSLFPILQHPNANKLNAKLSNVPNSLPAEKVQYADMLKDPKPQQPNEDHIQVGVIADSEQQLTLQLTLEEGIQLVTTLVYAKCSGKD